MKLKQIHISLGLLAALMLVLAMAGFTSCKDTETVDTSGFKLMYTSLTDIGPSMQGSIATPSYKGAAPSDFKITAVTFGEDNETFDNSNGVFVIDSSTGSIFIDHTENIAVGLYKISVSCVAGGVTYNFPDIVTVNFLNAVPEGVVVEPNLLVADQNDILDEKSEAKLPTAQVKVDETKEHITITGYAISNVRRGETIFDNKKYPVFVISESGQISIAKGKADKDMFIPGEYVIDLKLITKAADANSEEGLLTEALTVKVTSAPQKLIYKEGYIETGKTGDPAKPAGGFDSGIPELIGSLDGVNYAIVSVKKNGTEDQTAAAKFSIDPVTGRITVGADHGFTVDDVYTVDVNVTNDYSEDGQPVLMENALTLNVVEWIEELTEVTIADIPDGMRAMKRTTEIQFAGGEEALTCSFVDLDENLEPYMRIVEGEGGDAGKTFVEVVEGNEIAPGDYAVTVKVENWKGAKTGTFNLHVDENPCYFTYIHYGTNLDGDKDACENQFRFTQYEDVKSTTLTPTTDLNPDAGVSMAWSTDNAAKYNGGGIKVDGKTGVMTLSNVSESDWGKELSVRLVTLTATKQLDGEKAKYSRTVPVAFHYVKEVNGVKVEYTPFLFHVSPIYGGRSAVPVVTGAEASTFLLDYRRNFQYLNVDGVDSEGNPFWNSPTDMFKPVSLGNDNNDFILGHLYEACGTTNYGSKTPLSFYDTNNKQKTDLAKNTLAYVDNTEGSPYKWSVVVNPQMWYDDGWADGVFIGQMTFDVNADAAYLSNSNNKNQIFPIAIWLDKSLPQPQE